MFADALNEVLTYLEAQKERGVKYVQVSPQTLETLFPSPVPAARFVPSAGSVPFRALGQQQVPAFPKTVRPVPVARPLNPYADMNIKIDLSQPLSPEEKIKKMDALRPDLLRCTQCPHLVASRHNVVFGVGDVNSPLMFIGEAPGADEDAQGEPFVGRAGQLLTKIIAAMGLSRENVFIANILKCRPDTPGQSSGNRPPTPAEMKVCFPWLARQIEIVQPRVIVALGATAVSGLLAQTTPISRLRGHFQPFQGGIQVMPTFHPSYLLRYANSKVKRDVWEDMLQVMEFLGMPISEKQRGYFLPK